MKVSEAFAIEVGWHGWRIHFKGEHKSTLSGYGDDWRDHVTGVLGPLAHPGNHTVEADGRTSWEHRMDEESIPDDCPVIDIRSLPEDDEKLRTYVFSGPMIGDLPPGKLHRAYEGMIDFDKRPEIGRPARCDFLGNAHGLDHCAPDVKVFIANRIGIITTTAGEVRATIGV